MGSFHSVKVKTRLSKLVHRPGGKSREEAVSAALRILESARDDNMEAIRAQIASLEAIAGADMPQEQRLTLLTNTAGSIITLAGTYGLGKLAEACMRLCDLTTAFHDRGQWELAPVAVHIRTIRLLAPGTAQRTDPDVLLAGLRDVLTHYEIVPGPAYSES